MLRDAGYDGHLGDARLVVFGIVVTPRLRLPLRDGPRRDDAAVEVVAGDVFRWIAVPAYFDLILRQHRDDGLEGHARCRARAGAVVAFDLFFIDGPNHVKGRLLRRDLVIDKGCSLDLADPLELRLPRFGA